MGIFRKIFKHKERRHGQRYRLYETLYVDYRLPGKQKSGHGEGLDLTERSIRFAADDKFSKGDMLDLELEYQADFPQPKKVFVRGRVIRSMKKNRQLRYRTVCEFESIGEEDLRDLRLFINWLCGINARYLQNRYRPSEG